MPDKELSKFTYKSGFVALIGRPNTGKSTLLNRVVGRKISITTPKPQTTRHQILGIWHGDSAQIVFIDTPGVLSPSKRLDYRMQQTVLKTLKDSDLVIIMVDARMPAERDDDILVHIKGVDLPVFLLINKIDLIPKPKILTLIDVYKEHFPYREIIPISALTGDNCSDLIDTIVRYLPDAPPLYPEETITDQTERFITAELIREKLILLTRQEIPYVCAVIIDSLVFDPGTDLIRIIATVLVEKESQKGIIIGKKGKMLKEVGQRARDEIEVFLGKHVYLQMYVKVARNWRNNESRLKQFGY